MCKPASTADCRRWLGVLDKLPRFGIAVVCLLPILAFDYDQELYYRLGLPYDILPLIYLMTMSIPGAVKRRSRIHGIVAIVAAAIVWAANEYLYTQYSRQTHVILLLALPTSAILTINVVEWRFDERFSRSQLMLNVAMSVGAVSGYCVVQRFIEDVSLPENGVWEEPSGGFLVFHLLRWSFLCAAAWGAVAGAAWLRECERRTVMAAFSGAVAAALMCASYFTGGMFTLAERSITGTGPFRRYHAAVLLNVRGSQQDYELMLDQLVAETTVTAATDGVDWRVLCESFCRQHYGDKFDQIFLERIRLADQDDEENGRE